MLIFDQLKKGGARLRLLAFTFLGGMSILLAGLWWVQIVKARDFQAHLEAQSFRTVRVPAVRGKILDRNGTVLAENRPVYDIGLYLEGLSPQFKKEYAQLYPVRLITNSPPFWKRWFGYGQTVKAQRVRLNKEQTSALENKARYIVASNVVNRISQCLRQPISLNITNFTSHYKNSRAMPYPVLENIDARTIARFEEQSASLGYADLELQSTRVYPSNSLAAHLLGELQQDDGAAGEDQNFSYRLPDYRGVIGIEHAYDAELRGNAGIKSVLVNNLDYRQSENVLLPAEPGSNVVLTIDVRIQQAAEKALQRPYGENTRGAAVVMDVNTGDILALASHPAFDPNDFVKGISQQEYDRIQAMGAEKNRATGENYRPGSIFKTVIALACLEKGLDPNATYEVHPDPAKPLASAIYVGERKILDPARPGPYDLRLALIRSSNSYFVSNGIHVAGIEKIAELARRLHLGEGFNLGNRQESKGHFPSQTQIHSNWRDGDTANICFGQGYVDVTPLQMAVLASAIANGGKVLWPRLVDRIEPQDLLSGAQPVIFPKGRVRDNLGVKPGNLKILREDMLGDTEDPEGTAYSAFHNSPLPGTMRVCGKTGTAQNELNGRIDPSKSTTWFLSFAPYENPRYAVVVMIENGGSGGGTCAPIGKQIYEAILKAEQSRTSQTMTVTK